MTGGVTGGGDRSYPPVSPLVAGLTLRCPRCGEGKIFDGILTVAPRCSVCGLDISAQDAGDGPAVFVTLILGAVVVLLAIVVEISFAPPIWVHVVLWGPTILGGSILLLRPLKAGLIALQYRHLALGRGPAP
ncbi:MAG: hypothetical protein JWL84_4079 [Rhodospirillales bacterium]|nr:hypothetical protein [Rhodospirillales bacterium]